MPKTVAVMVVVLILALAGCREPQTAAPPAVPVNPGSTGANTESSGANTESPGANTGAPGAITWLDNLEEALAQAKKQDKTVLVDFHATWCGPCKQMDAKTWPDSQVVAASADFIMVKQDVDQASEAASRYKIDSVPTLVFIDSTGKELRRQVGALSATELLALMRRP